MKIVSARLKNYKSYLDSGVTELSPSFTVIVGQNDAGKTAFLEGVSSRLTNNPHRSLETVPHAGVMPNGKSQVELTIAFETFELLRYFDSVADASRWFPIQGDPARDPSMINQSLQALNDCRSIQIWTSGADITAIQLEGFPVWEFGMNLQMTQISLQDNVWVPVNNLLHAPIGSYWIGSFAELLRASIYAFKAERLNIAEGGISNTTELQSNAGNLAQVIHYLQSTSPKKYQRFVRYVRSVFPHILDITSPPQDDRRTRVLLWTIDPESERNDLAVSLQDSGTGIGQVLAVLYVVVTSQEGKTILIDEPQSFLHPGAVTKLIQILRQHPQHQFVVSTHSPNAILASDSSCVLLARRRGSQSEITQVDLEAPGQAQSLLADVGARLGDVFGADQILWVEGKTEEHCFPVLIDFLHPARFVGVKVLGVLHTSEFEKKDISRTIEIYQRLSGGALLVPPALHFLLDSEGLTASEKAELRSRSRERMSFLERRMFENYLIDPRAIASVLTTLDDESNPHSVGDVQKWLDSNMWNTAFFDGRAIPEPDKSRHRWEQTVHGGKLLEQLFNDLSNARVAYRKVQHGIALTKAMLLHAPDRFAELNQLLDRLAPIAAI